MSCTELMQNPYNAKAIYAEWCATLDAFTTASIVAYKNDALISIER